MGQKVSPISFRLVRTKKWGSVWCAGKKDFPALLKQDYDIRALLMKKPACASAAQIVIKRTSGKIDVIVATSKPGLVIGKKGAEAEQLRHELRQLTRQDVNLEVEEIKRADMSAKLVADGIARQLEKRIPFRRAMKKALQAAMDSGAAGVKIQVSGRLGGAEIARKEWYKLGSIPLHTIRANIDYAMGRSETTYGSIGVKVWINQGEAGV